MMPDSSRDGSSIDGSATSDERPPIRITGAEVQAANQLSLGCPICGSAVEKYVDDPARAPVICGDCNTLYHHACWDRKKDHCAVLGCQSTTAHRYGERQDPLLVITDSEVARARPRREGQTKQLKDNERRRAARRRQAAQEAVGMGFWNGLWRTIRQAFGR